MHNGYALLFTQRENNSATHSGSLADVSFPTEAELVMIFLIIVTSFVCNVNFCFINSFV